MKRTQLQERYELKHVLGRGGMGVVYVAHDRIMQRDVALKTILETDAVSTALFYNEWSLLATMVHPNVINIYDIGEFEYEGTKKPFFVMPLLPGAGLDQLIREESPRLNVAGVLEIIEQACRGLHAAHQQGLVHRDVKPSNIFVMEDGSVKVIDFGIARQASNAHTSSLRGTCPYMAPEQFDMSPATPLSDVFALGVVTYQALAKRRPFDGDTESQVIDAIRRLSPPPICSVNGEVSYAISQVVAKAMAKQPRHRFSTVREFGDALQKALRNEPLDWLDTVKLKARLVRASNSFEQGDYAFAADVLAELEAEGHLDPEIAALRGRVDSAVGKERSRLLLESARRFFDAKEYTLALRKTEEALELDPSNPTALALSGALEKQRGESRNAEHLAQARQHLDRQAFALAREALNAVLTGSPNDTAAGNLLAEVERQEQQSHQLREQKALEYQAASGAWDKGEVTAAWNHMEALAALERENPESDPEQSAAYRKLYDQVRTEQRTLQNAYDEGQRNLAAGNFDIARATAQRYLAKYPNHPLFQALQFDVDTALQQRWTEVIAETNHRVQAEADLSRRVEILEEALQLYPGESHLEAALQSVREKRELVKATIAKARSFEERGYLNQALDQWQIVKSIHPEQAETAAEIPRLIQLSHRQALESSRARWVEQVNQYLNGGDYERALRAAESGLAEFPGDSNLVALEGQARQQEEGGREALGWLAKAQEAANSGDFERNLQLLRGARQIDPRNALIRTVLVNSLLEQGARIVDQDWSSASELQGEALALEPDSKAAQVLGRRIVERKALASAAAASAASAAEDRVKTKTLTFPAPSAPSVTATATVADTALPVPAIETGPISPGVEPGDAEIAAEEKAGPVPPAQPVTPVPAAPARKVLFALIAGMSVLLVMAVVALVIRQPKPPPLPAKPVEYRVRLITTVLGATINVNGQVCGTSQCDLTLGAGNYLAEAQMPGYLSGVATFTITADKGPPPAIELNLLPAPSSLSILTDLPDTPLLIDGAPAGNLQFGSIEISSLAAGQHVIILRNGDLQASFGVEVAAGVMLRFSAPMQVKGMRAFVVTQSGKEARIYAGEGRIKATLDGRPLGEVPSDGLEVKPVATGPHEVIFDGPPGQQEKMSFEAKSAPGTYVKLTTVRRAKR